MKRLPWQALRVIFEGKSILDLPKLELKNEAEAYQFILSYGYDIFEPTHAEQLWKIYEESLIFLEQTLEHAVPESLKQLKAEGDIRQLLLIASGDTTQPNSAHRLTICALLRVMHVVAHVHNDLRLKYLSKIRRQTIERIDAHLQRVVENEKEQLYLGFERDKVPLVNFEKKESKERSRIFLKLLHKTGKVAGEIYDFLGVRFVTRTRAESILVVKYLVEHHLISIANVMAARCRNSLLDLANFEDQYISQQFEDFISQPLEALQKIDKSLTFPKDSDKSENPFSARGYHALQFTCRPLIRIPVIRKGKRAEISFFFPLEVQILDGAAFKATQDGQADHTIYKEKQLAAVKERVLRG